MYLLCCQVFHCNSIFFVTISFKLDSSISNISTFRNLNCSEFLNYFSKTVDTKFLGVNCTILRMIHAYNTMYHIYSIRKRKSTVTNVFACVFRCVEQQIPLSLLSNANQFWKKYTTIIVELIYWRQKTRRMRHLIISTNMKLAYRLDCVGDYVLIQG